MYSQLPQTNEIQFAKAVSEIQSEVREHRVFKICLEVKPQSAFTFDAFIYYFPLFVLQSKYKEAGKKEASSSLYSKLPETLETQHAKEVAQLQSQVLTSQTREKTQANVPLQFEFCLLFGVFVGEV